MTASRPEQIGTIPLRRESPDRYVVVQAGLERLMATPAGLLTFDLIESDDTVAVVFIPIVVERGNAVCGARLT